MHIQAQFQIRLGGSNWHGGSIRQADPRPPRIVGKGGRPGGGGILSVPGLWQITPLLMQQPSHPPTSNSQGMVPRVLD